MNMDKPKFLIKEFLNNIQISNNEQISKLLEVHLSTSVKNVESQNLLKTVQDKINMTEHKNQEFLNNSDVVQNKIKNNLTLKHEILKNHLKHHNIMMKDYADYNIILIYTNYNIIKPTNLQRECRSIIIDRNTFNIIAYTCEIPIVNKDGFAFLHNIYNNNYSNIDIDKNNIITSCYEGTLCAIFHYNNKWYLYNYDKCNYTILDNIDEFINKNKTTDFINYVLTNNLTADNKLRNKFEKIVFSSLSVFLLLFYVISAVWIPAPTQYHNGIYVLVTYILVFMLYKSKHPVFRVFDYVLMIAAASSVIYWIHEYESLNYRAGMESELDQYVAAVGVILGIEIARRAVGFVFVIIGVVMLAYGILGPYAPDLFMHPGDTFLGVCTTIFFREDGVFGIMANVLATYVLLFVLMYLMCWRCRPLLQSHSPSFLLRPKQ